MAKAKTVRGQVFDSLAKKNPWLISHWKVNFTCSTRSITSQTSANHEVLFSPGRLALNGDDLVGNDITMIIILLFIGGRLPTYGAFGVGAVLAVIYMTNWETVGRRIPLWKYHFEPIAAEESNSTNAAP
ncbi:unnamed protein product [Acanthocheilonema viteae]|uniref:Uncharacterized protein n=1 Tax=Acanthocheilonema viteae TaxID=6277 RepID=A0A498S968_ACAVI|nr:unnamed protein product [Acanthocheilonema viteae]